MYLEAVYLPVFEETAHDDRARLKQLFAGGAETGVGRGTSVVGQPGVDRAIRNIHVEAAAEN